jgi:hypothetical protein
VLRHLFFGICYFRILCGFVYGQKDKHGFKCMDVRPEIDLSSSIIINSCSVSKTLEMLSVTFFVNPRLAFDSYIVSRNLLEYKATTCAKINFSLYRLIVQSINSIKRHKGSTFSHLGNFLEPFD